MFTGIDIGGTNTDIAVIDSQIQTYKIPNSSGLKEALALAANKGRLVVSTSQPLNEILTGPPADIRTITIPGPGLVYPGAVKGAVSHRGDVLEPIDSSEIERLVKGTRAQGIAIAGKFSVRNPSLEKEVLSIVSAFYSDDQIAMSAPLGTLNFPARITTTRLNARIKPKVASLIHQIRSFNENFLFVTSTGGLTGPERAYDNPSLLYHSSPATVATGAYYLSRTDECLVVDIGGTTTELVPIVDGKPLVDMVIIDGQRTLISAVKAKSIPFGGDSCVREDLCRFRAGSPRSFGGGEPTLTDALNVLGARIGDENRSMVMDEHKARLILDQYLSTVSDAIVEFKPKMLIGTGYLAHYLLSDLAERVRTTAVVPEHAASANAVGAAVSRVSIEVHLHADSEQHLMTLNGVQYPYSGRYDDESLIEYAKDLVRDIARKEGAPEEDVRDVSILFFSAYNVVRGWRISARITDMILGIVPGISVEAL